MATRYVTYDIDENNSYDDLYDILNDIDAEEITESTYLINEDIEFKDLCSKLENATSPGDKVVLIYRTKESIKHKVIR